VKIAADKGWTADSVPPLPPAEPAAGEAKK
jgi:hypothetical protein